MKRVKIIIFSLIFFILISSANVYGLSLQDIFDKANSFKTQESSAVIKESTAENELLGVGQILVVVANAVVVIAAAIMGVKWITAKPDQAAKLKQQLIGLVVSIFVIYGAFGIWNLVKGIMSGF